MKKTIFLLLSVVVLLSFSSCVLSSKGERTGREECLRDCRQQPRYDEGMRRSCESKCGGGGGSGRRRGSWKDEWEGWNPNHHEGSEKKLQQCREACRHYHQSGQTRALCQHRCAQRFQEEHHGDVSRDYSREMLQACEQRCRTEHHGKVEQGVCEVQCAEEYRRRKSTEEQNYRRDGEEEMEEEEGYGVEESGSRRGQQLQGEKKTYIYGDRSFKHRVRSRHGSVKVLEEFTNFSPLLRGIENFRLAILEANPNTFIMPNHLDAEAILYVAYGRGKINLIFGDNEKVSHDIRRGDVIRVPSGTVVYLVNNDESQTLYIAKLLKTISTPGEFKEYFGVGGQNPQSFYSVFSNDLLEAAFNTESGRIQSLFGQQRQGPIIKASREQLRGIGGGMSKIWPFGGGGGHSSRPFNLLDKKPSHANNNGQLYEVDANDYRQLHELDLMVSLVNITSGSMMAPFYNSRATKISLVLKGNGYMEMACPHTSSQHGQPQRGEEQPGEEEEEEETVQYQQIKSDLHPGVAFVVPTGHPVITVSTGDENLEIMCFEIKARNNQKYFLAGRNNVLNQLDDEAKELSFDRPADEVNDVFNSQTDEVFFPGPEGKTGVERSRGRRSRRVSNIMDAAVAGF